MTINELKRGTGRTSRLIEYAIQMADEGRAVYVYVLGSNIGAVVSRIKELRPDFVPLGPRAIGPIKVETLDRTFDWITGKVLGAHPNCVFLVDHAVVEQVAIFKACHKLWSMFDESESDQAANGQLSLPRKPATVPAKPSSTSQKPESG